MTVRCLRVGTRPSRLAVKQVEEIRALLPDILFKVITIETEGDRDKATPLSALEGTDFFTREIEEALLSGWIDLGIHSAKDVEDEMPEGLIIAAITASISPYDCLVVRQARLCHCEAERSEAEAILKRDCFVGLRPPRNDRAFLMAERLPFAQLSEGAIVGTSSIKRRKAIQKFRKDLVIKDIRGDIDERLQQLDRGDFDAIVVAHAALTRLGYEARIAEIISEDIIKPHPLQGKLAIQIRRDRTDLADIFRRIDAN